MQDLEEGTSNIPLQSVEVHTRASDSILKSDFETNLSKTKSGKGLSVSIWGRGLVLFYLPGVATMPIYILAQIVFFYLLDAVPVCT